MDNQNGEGEFRQFTSRERRKLLSALDTDRGSTWWAPGAVGWWVGVLFAIGATLFALGSVHWYAEAVGKLNDALTYYIGSIFFTSAAALQYLEAANAGPGKPGAREEHRIRVFTWRPMDLAWLSSLVQLAGTLLFNKSTFQAVQLHLTASSIDDLVWRPDIYGSVCFLIASGLAWYEFTRRVWEWKPGSLSWRIVALNLLGSFAFWVSAVSAFVVHATGHQVDKTLVNLGTFAGAACFLAAAIMLLPERTQKTLD
ncbi:MAG: hypothetical protein ACYC99_03665 [Candidatus Geothermincolia bacterium]